MSPLEITQENLRATMKGLEELYPGMFMCLLIGPYHPGICNYISNGQRQGVIDAMRETADRLEESA